jgi:hypothetical protein
MNASPLKPPKAKKEDDVLEKFKKPKAVISKSTVKKIAEVKSVDKLGCEWADRWVTQLIRERCLPPQLLSEDFESVLGKFMIIKDALEILEQFRNDYRRAFPLALVEDSPDTLDWLRDTLRADPAALDDLPPHYLD